MKNFPLFLFFIQLCTCYHFTKKFQEDSAERTADQIVKVVETTRTMIVIGFNMVYNDPRFGMNGFGIATFDIYDLKLILCQVFQHNTRNTFIKDMEVYRNERLAILINSNETYFGATQTHFIDMNLNSPGNIYNMITLSYEDPFTWDTQIERLVRVDDSFLLFGTVRYLYNNEYEVIALWRVDFIEENQIFVNSEFGHQFDGREDSLHLEGSAILHDSYDDEQETVSVIIGGTYRSEDEQMYPNITIFKYNCHQRNITWSYSIETKTRSHDIVVNDICPFKDAEDSFLFFGSVTKNVETTPIAMIGKINAGGGSGSGSLEFVKFVRYIEMTSGLASQGWRCQAYRGGFLGLVIAGEGFETQGWPYVLRIESDGNITYSVRYDDLTDASDITLFGDDFFIGGQFTQKKLHMSRVDCKRGIACPTKSHNFCEGLDDGIFSDNFVTDDFYLKRLKYFPGHGNVASQVLPLEGLSILPGEIKNFENPCFVCYGIWDIYENEVCSGRGKCVDPDTCICDKNWGEVDYKTCSGTTCNGVLSNMTGEVCSGFGSCEDFDVCECRIHYNGSDCSWTTCEGIPNDSSEVCNHRNGTCFPYNTCKCFDNYFGSNCEVVECFGVLSNSTDVCRGLGTENCILPDHCLCQNHLDPYNNCFGCESGWYYPHPMGHEGKYSFEVCNITKCKGIFSNDTEAVCNHGKGVCVSPDRCECDVDSRYTGNDCDVCKEGYYDPPECSVTCCYGIYSNDSDVCSNRNGDCVDPDTCNCPSLKWGGKQCQKPYCYGCIGDDEDLVCGGKGRCEGLDLCSCETGYFGVNCYERVKPPEFYNLQLFNDLFISYILPKELFMQSKEEQMGGKFNCSLIISNSEQFLNYHTSYCQFSFSVPFVDFPNYLLAESLYIHIISEEEIGGLLDPDEYKIEDNFTINFVSVSIPQEMEFSLRVNYFEIYDDNPKKNNKGVVKNGLEWLSIPIVGVFVIILILCCYLCCFFACCIFCCTLLGETCAVIIPIVISQRRKLKKFNQIDDFELLLHQQLLDSDNTIPHLKIDTSLFEIPYSDIRIERLIGRGGSKATVYLARWGNKRVAFKSFRVESSAKFDFSNLESEISFLGSLNHPFIVNFFGASLKLPRVGIVMEYCPNGEIFNFLRNYSMKNRKKAYPTGEKLRLCKEIVEVMAYIHSRNIIHRDLKNQNVLISENENCKLTDFGISRVIDDSEGTKTSNIGTNIYMAPELLTENETPYKSVQAHSEHEEGVSIEFRVSNDPTFRPDLGEIKSFKNKSMRMWLKKIISKSWNHEPTYRPSFESLKAIFEEKIMEIEAVDCEDIENYEDSEEENGSANTLHLVVEETEDEDQTEDDFELGEFLGRTGRTLEKIKKECVRGGSDFTTVRIQLNSKIGEIFGE